MYFAVMKIKRDFKAWHLTIQTTETLKFSIPCTTHATWKLNEIISQILCERNNKENSFDFSVCEQLV